MKYSLRHRAIAKFLGINPEDVVNYPEVVRNNYVIKASFTVKRISKFRHYLNKLVTYVKSIFVKTIEVPIRQCRHDIEEARYAGIIKLNVIRHVFFRNKFKHLLDSQTYIKPENYESRSDQIIKKINTLYKHKTK